MLITNARPARRSCHRHRSGLTGSTPPWWPGRLHAEPRVSEDATGPPLCEGGLRSGWGGGAPADLAR
eukprot:2162400-Alexandrium_andersonii.AAC.1